MHLGANLALVVTLCALFFFSFLFLNQLHTYWMRQDVIGVVYAEFKTFFNLGTVHVGSLVAKRRVLAAKQHTFCISALQ